jgi:L-lactate permease
MVIILSWIAIRQLSARRADVKSANLASSIKKMMSEIVAIIFLISVANYFNSSGASVCTNLGMAEQGGAAS